MLWDKSFRTWAFVKQTDHPLWLSAETGNGPSEKSGIKKNLLRAQQLSGTDCIQRGCLGFSFDFFLFI